MTHLPKNAQFYSGEGEPIDFILSDKREIRYYGKSKDSNEYIWRTESLEDDEVLYETIHGWGLFVNTTTNEIKSLDGKSWVWFMATKEKRI